MKTGKKSERPRIADTADLRRELEAKALTSHTQPISSVTGLQAALDAKQATLVSATNIKTINGSSILGAGDLAVGGGGAHAASHQNGGADEINVAGLSGVLADPQTPATHTHAIADTTGLQTALDGKAATGHSHAGVYEPADAAIQTHITAAHAPANAQKNSDITKAEIEAKLTGVIASHSHAGGADPFATFIGQLAADVSTAANVTPVNVTGLVFNFIANSTYIVEVFGAITAPAATTGVGLQLDVSAAVTSVWGTFFHQLANTGTLTGGSTIADDASAGVSSGISANAAITPFYASFIVKTGANAGTAQLRLRSEVAAVSTIKAGTTMRVHKAL